MPRRHKVNSVRKPEDKRNEELDRRSAIKILAAGTVALNLGLTRWAEAAQSGKMWVPNFWNETQRPDFVWENHEDRMYHDLDMPVPEIQTAPEFFAFMGQVWVFNKSMQWHRENLHGAILCHSTGNVLLLTGEHQVSKWHSDSRNTLSNLGETTRFEKKSGRRRDCAVLPAFQFHLGQHPVVELSVEDANAAWQFCVSIKGRSGPPFVSTSWQSGPRKFKLDLAKELSNRGYDLNFAELHFAIGLWTDDPTASASITFQVQLPTQAAVVGCLPVIRSADSVLKEGLPIVGLMLNQKGERDLSRGNKVTARLGGREIPLQEQNGLWFAQLQNVKPGEHFVELISEGAVAARTTIPVRVTNGEYLHYDHEHRSMTRGGKLIGPLTGSYQGTFYFKDGGLPTETLINSQSEWDAWDRSVKPGEHLHYWESLTESELEKRFSYLETCGWDLLHLHQHWGVWERLDAGGRISPHGAEQVALYMRVADRHKLALIQSLSSYEYAVHRVSPMIGGTPPWSIYVDAGFQDSDWYKPQGTIFRKMFRQYLSDFLSIFKEETALAGMLASGEGDHENGPEVTNDIFHYVRSIDTNHLFLAEPLFGPPKLPKAQSAGFEEELFGDRTYFLGDEFLPEYDLAVMYKHLQIGRNYLAEGSWPTPNIYTALHYELLKNDHEDPGPESWVGTLRYRTRLRDTYYLGLVHRMPIIDTWDEYLAEDEHTVIREIRDLVKWDQAFREPLVAIQIDDDSYGKTRERVIHYETFLSKIPLSSRYILPDSPVSGDAAVILNTKRPLENLAFQSEGGILPDSLKSKMPLNLSAGYNSNYLWSVDGRTLLAYVYNTTNHTEQKLWICGRYHRIPKPAQLNIQLMNLPGTSLKYRIFDLNLKKVALEGHFKGAFEKSLGETDRDFFVLITPS